MDQTSNVSSLKKLLQEKTQQDQQENRQLVLNEQQKLLNDLQNTYRSALNTTLTDIRESLKSRLSDMAMLTAQEAQTVEKMVADHQEKLIGAIEKIYTGANRKIKAQTIPTKQSLDDLTASMNKLTATAEQAAKATARSNMKNWLLWLASILVVLMIGLAGSWGLIQYQADKIQSNLVQIDQQQQTLDYLLSQTSGLRIVQASNGLFLILPDGAQSGFELGDRPAIKLPTN